MKPILLEFSAFGPYVSKQVIDFTDLEKHGLFLICGETGSGKTMILDAMTFALFGKSSGNLRDDFKSMRSTYAEWDDTTYVRFIFSVGGNFYRFERRLERKTKNLSDKYSAEKYTGAITECNEFDEKLWEPIFENPRKSDLDNLSKELIGLDYDQFRQVTILPQGQFERLLVSSSDEKEKILTTIFGVHDWQRIAEHFYAAAEKRKNELTGEKQLLDNALAEEDCSKLEELCELISNKQEELSALDNEYEKQNYKVQIDELQAELALSAKFALLDDTKNRLVTLLSKKDEQEKRENKENKANRAEKVRPCLDEVTRCEAELNNRKNKIDEVNVQLEKTKINIEQAECLLKEHKLEENQIEDCRKRVVVYEEKRDVYKQYVSYSSELAEIEKELKDIKKHEAIIKEECDKIDQTFTEIQIEEANEMDITAKMTRLYLNNIGAELACSLVDGKECPVCGSTSHPHIAQMTDEHVTKVMLDAQREKESTIISKLEEVRIEREKKHNDLAEQNKKTVTLNERFDNKVSEGNRIKEALIEGISDLEMLENKIKASNDKVSAYDKKLSELVEKNDKAKAELAIANQTMILANDEFVKAKELYDDSVRMLESAVKENDFSDVNEVKASLLDLEDRNRLREMIAAYTAEISALSDQINKLETDLAGRDKPDEEKCRLELERIDVAKEEYTRNSTGLKQEIQRLNTKYDKCNQISEKYESQIREAEEDFSFAKSLRGDTGTGLQRYVLGIMFDSVINAANQMLSKVHNGRYILIRTDEKEQGSNKRGLGLKVHETSTKEVDDRFVYTLSGGEKFLVSLALSIGLSTIAQRGGIKIEALFIDEGFGSLDDSSIEDALDILGSIQKSSGVMGIISHVQLLQEQITSKLVIDKNKGISNVRTVLG